MIEEQFVLDFLHYLVAVIFEAAMASPLLPKQLAQLVEALLQNKQLTEDFRNVFERNAAQRFSSAYTHACPVQSPVLLVHFG